MANTDCGCGTTGIKCTFACHETVAGCAVPISEALTCTLPTIDLSCCVSGTVPDTCQSNQVCT